MTEASGAVPRVLGLTVLLIATYLNDADFEQIVAERRAKSRMNDQQ